MYTTKKIKLAFVKPVFTMIGKKKISETNLISGVGSISKIGNLISEKKVERALIITDEVLYNLGLLSPMIDSLDEKKISYCLYTGVKPDPTFTIVEEAIEICKKNNCQAVIGFGGGSTLDTAKTVAASAGNHYINPRKLVGTMKLRKHPIPVIAIPTTAGTGSEVTIAAIVSDPISHQKMMIIDPKLPATNAILDPAITTSLPGHITTTTGLDALTHAVEAYISGFANRETDKMALKAIKLITENLELVYKQPDNLKGRENLLLGSMYAGQAFTRTYVGYVHAFSHNIGGQFGVSHGLGNAVLLPLVMNDAKQVVEDRFAQLSDFLELTDKTLDSKQKAQSFIDYLFNLNKQLDIPKRLEAFPESGINAVIDGAFKEAHGTYPVPKYYTHEEAYNLLLKVCAQ